MEEKFLIAMVGPAYSGKTTLSEFISKRTGAKHISYDWTWASLKPPDHVPDIDNVEEWTEVLEITRNTIKEELSSGNSVIFDHINHTRADRAVLSRIASDNGARYFIVNIKIPKEIIDQRRQDNLINLTRHHVTSDNLAKGVRTWEEPGEDEPVIFYQGEDIDQWLNENRINRPNN